MPDERLRSYIYCYWQLKTILPLATPFNYCVIADGCIDIFFECDTPAENYIMGFSTTAAEFSLGCSFNYVGIRFLPSAFPALFDVNAAELSNKVELLSVVKRPLANVSVLNFDSGISMAETKLAFDNYFLKVISSISIKADARFMQALQIILSRHGILQVEKDLPLPISSRHLRRLFEYYIGGTPKVFSNVVRFQNTIKSSLKNNFVSCDGYYDQAHLIKAFKTLYGQTPGKALKN